jgi:hypothetical protein
VTQSGGGAIRVTSPPGRWRRLGKRIGRRGDTLLFLALVDVLYSITLFCPLPESRLSPATLFISHVAPLWAWGVLWFSTGLVLLAGAFAKRDRWAFTAAVGLKVLWGGTFLAGWMFAGLERGWVSALIWLAMARWAYRVGGWPEPGERGGR